MCRLRCSSVLPCRSIRRSWSHAAALAGYQSFPWWQWPRQGSAWAARDTDKLSLCICPGFLGEAPLDQTEEIQEMQEELARIDACAAKKETRLPKFREKIVVPKQVEPPRHQEAASKSFANSRRRARCELN